MPHNPLGALPIKPLGEYIREQRRNAQYSVRQLAQAAGVSNPYLSQIERGLRKPSAEILQQLAKALRISAETLYVQAGLLDGEGAAEASTIMRRPRAAGEGAGVVVCARPSPTIPGSPGGRSGRCSTSTRRSASRARRTRTTRTTRMHYDSSDIRAPAGPASSELRGTS